MKINQRLSPVLLIGLLLFGGCSTAKRPPASTTLAPVPPKSEPGLEPSKTPVEELKQSLEEHYYDKVAEAVIQKTHDTALKIDLMTSLQEVRMARKNLRGMENTGVGLEHLTPEQARNKAFWIQKYNSRSKELRELIEASAEMFWIDFRKFNQKELTAVGHRQLAQLGPELSEWCSRGREIIVAGFGCSTGGEDGTLIVSSVRATNTANWIIEHSKCERQQIANIGMGMIVEEAYEQAAATPAGEELLAQKRHALVLILRNHDIIMPLN